ncbi:DsbA family oxidoreductase [Nonomuraea mesophila]|uniref:DsbA family oxidoreductase n=1 Tax=Nonomuraea mesophila TaxID=2530382 RepID=A0A4R5FY25_9ACTN|nr:DsbA family oxidoreductase [Nonomuraea mesophila]TDE60424.1 DsbA family oxidoreductase [Nonomuraea mesophila]
MIERREQGTGSRVAIEVWADLGCPWCYVAKHRLEAAISQRPDADRFEIVMRSFQLDPTAPQGLEKNETSFVRSHPGSTADDLRRAERQMQAIANKEGLRYTVDRWNANTFDLHRVVQYAGDQGRGFAFFSAVQDGFFAGVLNPFDPDALVEVAESVGLDGRRVRDIVAGDEYADRVRADRQEAVELGSTGVPFVVFDRRVGAPGAQKVAAYDQLLEQVAGPAPSERAS